MRILLVEDDAQIGSAIASALDDAGMAADWVTDGSAALASVDAGAFELMLLDIGLPKRDGFSVLKQLRQNGSTIPVIMITARDGVDDRIQGLDMGADDYLVKPFLINELLARVRAVARRHSGRSQPFMAGGDLMLDPSNKKVTYKESELDLTAREYRLLQALLSSPGRIYSREELEEKVYGWEDEVNSNAIEFLIHGLRKKTSKQAIRNVRGLGWMVPET